MDNSRSTTEVKSKDSALYNAIFDAVLEQRLRPGTRIAEQSLAEHFSVSRTVVRKVLQQLASDDVLCIEANKGASVALTPPELALDYLHTRMLLEVELAKLAAGRITERDQQRLTKIHARELRYREKGERGKMLRMSAELHFAIASISGNEPMAAAARRVVSRCELIVAQYERSGVDQGCACVDHGGLIEALASGDPTIASAVMREHLHGIEEKLQLTSSTNWREVMTP